MIWKQASLLAAVSFSSLASAAGFDGFGDCGSHVNNDVTLGNAVAELERRPDPSHWDKTPKIPIHFHVAVRENDTADVASELDLREEFEIVRDHYTPYGFQLTWGGYSRTRNNTLTYLDVDEIEWRADDLGIEGADPAHNEWWQATRTGGYDEIHVWMYTNCSGTNLSFVGMATFPAADRPPSKYWTDGIHWRIGALPGGNEPHYNRGIGLVHEIGHWLSLYHTFEGGCDLSTGGDFIADTPAHSGNKTYAYRCDIIDSCPELPGIDPFHNYMSYAGDYQGCVREFTPLQTKRMHKSFRRLRAGK